MDFYDFRAEMAVLPALLQLQPLIITLYPSSNCTIAVALKSTLVHHAAKSNLDHHAAQTSDAGRSRELRNCYGMLLV